MTKSGLLLVGVAIPLLGLSGGNSTGGVRDLYIAAGIQQVTGKPAAPAFSGKTLEGELVESSRLRGKVVVVNFWATWCGPCKEEMPALQRLRETFRSNEFELLAITTDQQEDAIRAFVNELGLEFPIILDETKDISGAFGVRGLPMTVLIDQRGYLRGRAVGPRAWDGPNSVALVQSLLEPIR